MNASLYRKVGIASLIMAVSIFSSRLIGLLREVVIAYAGGAGGDVDAYQVSFILPEILNHIAASGFLSVTFIPIFSGYIARKREEEGWRVLSVVFTCFGSLLAAGIVIGELFTPQLVSVLAPGLTDPASKELAVRMTRIILPAQFFFFAGGLFMAVQFAKEKFILPAMAPLFYNLGIIAGGMVLGPRLGIEGFSWGVLGGSLIGNFALQYRGAVKAGMRLSFSFDPRHPDLMRYIRLTLPLMVGLTMTFSTELFLKFFGSFLPEGSIASLNYGMRVMLILAGIFGQAVGVASFPFMAALAAENRLPEMNRLLNRSLRLLSPVIPFSVLLIALRYEVVRILFQRGRFDAAATELTAGVLVYLSAGAFAFTAQTLVVRGYYAAMDTLFPTVLGTLAVLASIPIYLLGMRWLGIEGIALSVSFSAILQVALLYSLWNRRTGNTESREVYRTYAGMIVFSIPLGFLLEEIRALLSGVRPEGAAGDLAVIAALGILFIAILFAAGRIFRIGEITVLTDRLMRRRHGL